MAEAIVGFEGCEWASELGLSKAWTSRKNNEAVDHLESEPGSLAYDIVEWNFLEAMMRKLSFNERWVQLTMSLVKSVELAVVINGKLRSYFKPTCRIHQGDPLSPYLFLFVIEATSSLRHAKLWIDCWIPSLHDGKLHPHLHASFDPNTRVTWNLATIRASVSHKECTIRLIPTRSGRKHDRLVWPKEKNGEFSV
ncbi:unnamed protein product [Prunus brigantina]